MRDTNVLSICELSNRILVWFKRPRDGLGHNLGNMINFIKNIDLIFIIIVICT